MTKMEDPNNTYMTNQGDLMR